MGSGKISNIAEVKVEVAKIKKMVSKLYDRPIIPKSMVTKVVLKLHIENIWEILDLVEEPREKRKKKINGVA